MIDRLAWRHLTPEAENPPTEQVAFFFIMDNGIMMDYSSIAATQQTMDTFANTTDNTTTVNTNQTTTASLDCLDNSSSDDFNKRLLSVCQWIDLMIRIVGLITNPLILIVLARKKVGSK